MTDTGENKQDLIKEAQERIARLVSQTHRMRGNEKEFILSMDQKLKQYGQNSFVSEKQLSWLRALDKQYVSDPRQQTLF